jgi:hypothetical protein
MTKFSSFVLRIIDLVKQLPVNVKFSFPEVNENQLNPRKMRIKTTILYIIIHKYINTDYRISAII